MDRLQVLIFSFYREDLAIQAQLLPLITTTMSRGMGNINIECQDSEHLRSLITIVNYIKWPILLMKLARNMHFSCLDNPDLKFSMNIETGKIFMFSPNIEFFFSTL